MDLHLELDRAAALRPQVERRLREAIRAGRLHAGTRLPPTRTLARDLGVSRGVVVEAYAQLVAEGWLVARRGAGTSVAPRAVAATPRGQTPLGSATTDLAAPDSAGRGGMGAGESNIKGFDPRVVFDLRTGRVDLSAFPRSAWHAAVGRALRTLPDAALDYGDPRGHRPLRAALAEHLGRTRGLVTDAERVVVCGGISPGLPAVWRALARDGALRVAVEDPGWRGQPRTVEIAGHEAVPVPVDERGIVVDALPRDVGAVLVTPAHQFPTGVVLAPERRAQLLDWARRTGGVIVEDDYDAEYRYDRDPVGALQGLAPEHVVYAGSVSKTLAPALRLGWLAVPDRLLHAVAEEKDRADRGTPVIDQAALADLLGRGDVDRHLRRTRRSYRLRRDALVAALGEHLPHLEVSGAAAGLHLVLGLPDGADEAEVAAAARARGIALDGLQAHCSVSTTRPGALLLGYAVLPEAALARAAAELATAIATAAAR